MDYSSKDLISYICYPDPTRSYGWIAKFEYPDYYMTFNGDMWLRIKK